MYLDNAASTKVSKNVIDKLNSILFIYGNPSSQHKEGFKAKQIITEATEIISKTINSKPDEIYYTSGATMSNNLIIQGFLRKHSDGLILYSTIEHNDIIMMAEYFGASKFVPVPVDKNGNINVFELNQILSLSRQFPVLVSIQAANGEMGTVQNIQMLSNLIHSYPDSYFHSDMTQYIPYYKVDVKELGIDALSMSGQKINCIKGTGMMYVSNELPISSLLFGEQGLVGGTENVIGIGCLGEAFKNLNYDNDELIKKRNYFIDNLGLPLVGDKNNRLPNNICVIINKGTSEEFVELLNEFDLYVSAGSACSSGSLEPSHVMMALGYDKEEANRELRITIDKDISYEDIDNAIKIMKNLIMM